MTTTRPSGRTMRRWRTRTWLVGLTLLALLAAGGGIYWFTRSAPSSAAALEPTTVTVSPETYRVTVAGPGTLAASESFAVTTSVAGTVASIARAGERVNAGDVVAQLEPAPFERAVTDAQLTLQQAQAQVSSLAANQSDSAGSLNETLANTRASVTNAQREVSETERTLALTERLHSLGSESAEAVQTARDAYDGALETLAAAQLNLSTLEASQTNQTNASASELENARLAVAQAELKLEDAQADLAATTITAPFDGVVSSVVVQVGGNVFSEGTLMTLIDDTTVELQAQVDETEIGQVALGQSAELTLDAFPNETFTGTVTSISPEATLESNIPIFAVTVELENSELSLRPGMTAEAEIIVEQLDNAVTLPLEALQTSTVPAGLGRPNAGAATEADGDGPGITPTEAGDAAVSTPGVRSAGGRPSDGAGDVQEVAGRAGAPITAEAATTRTITTVQVEQEDGSYAPVPVQLIDTSGLSAVVTGNLAAGDVVLVPEGSDPTATSDVRQPSGLPLGTGRSPGGFGGGRP